MLAVSPLRSPKGERERAGGGHGGLLGADDDDDFLDYIDFSCADVPFTSFGDGDVLPDLEVDPAELLAEFSSEGCLGGAAERTEVEGGKEEAQAAKCADEVVSGVTAESSAAAGSDTRSSASAEGHSKRKSSPAAAKNSQGKRKVKVDWTPELHRRFVQAVEQLGIEKAVPSRILELMGVDGLTRHNIASHLQKYRSHRKHLRAREAEAAGWTHKRQMCAASAGRHDMNAWFAPTIGFPHPHPPHPPPPLPPVMFQPAFRPLHVWGHPTAVDASMARVWPRHLAPQPLQPMPHPPADPSYWHQQYTTAMRNGWSPHAATQASLCIPHPIPTMSVIPGPMVPGLLPYPMYRPIPPPLAGKHAALQLQLDAHLSKESIDAAIGDVLEKPWLPLPLGLKPPSLESVMLELQKQGVFKVPPTTSSAA